MPTDEERREVARRLRDVEKHAIPDARISDNPMTAEFIAAAVFYDLPYVRGLFARLADLIEPSDGQNERDVSAGLDCGTRVDRDALLKLADEIEYGAGTDDGEYDDMPGFMVAAIARQEIAYARRIREALGVGR